MPAQRGRRRCERTSKSTASGSLDRSVRLTVVTSSRAGAPTHSSSDRRNLAQPPVPPWAEVDVFVAADRAAWETVPLRIAKGVEQLETPTPDGRKSLELIAGLATLRKPVQSPDQLVHGDLFGTVLFSGSMAPGITDITPYWRPAAWAAAVAVVDAISWGGADEALVGRWEDLPEWPQMLLRAVMFRLAVHVLHPRSTADAFPGLARTSDIVRLLL